MALDINGWKSSNDDVNSLMVNDVEMLLAVKLPQSYIELMKEWNGGFLQEEHQILVDGIIPEKLNYYLGEKLWALSAVAGISTDIKNSEGIVCVTQTAREWGIPEGVIAFDGDGHTWIAFDYRRSPIEPKIIFIESDELIYYDLAENFSAFISRLIPSSQIFDHDGNIISP